jgi:hypothetical protein
MCDLTVLLHLLSPWILSVAVRSPALAAFPCPSHHWAFPLRIASNNKCAARQRRGTRRGAAGLLIRCTRELRAGSARERCTDGWGGSRGLITWGESTHAERAAPVPPTCPTAEQRFSFDPHSSAQALSGLFPLISQSLLEKRRIRIRNEIETQLRKQPARSRQHTALKLLRMTQTAAVGIPGSRRPFRVGTECPFRASVSPCDSEDTVGLQCMHTADTTCVASHLIPARDRATRSAQRSGSFLMMA